MSSQQFFYEFAAIRGIQAGRPYYVAMCPLNVIPKIFSFEEADVAADFRSQRALNPQRVPEIANYIVENADSYAFSSITASVDGDVQFYPSAPDQPDIGRLKVDMTATLHINDGQHRRAAIERALEQAPELATETISVVLFPDLNLKRRQQLFADLNKYAVRPTASLNVLYDRRNDMASLTRAVIDAVPVFRDLTELERNSISHTSRKLFTLSSIHQATTKLLGKGSKAEVSEQDVALAISFWGAVAKAMPAWRAVHQGRRHAGELRRDEIQTCGVVLHAMAFAGRALIDAHPSDWKDRLAPLSTVDWSRRNREWEGRALYGGVLKKSRVNIGLTANTLKRTLGLALSADDKKLEATRARAA